MPDVEGGHVSSVPSVHGPRTVIATFFSEEWGLHIFIILGLCNDDVGGIQREVF